MNYREFEFVALFNDNNTVAITPVEDFTDPRILDAVRRRIAAEVSVPYCPNTEVTICYTFYIFNKSSHEIAIEEAAILYDIIDDVHRDFGARLKESNNGQRP